MASWIDSHPEPISYPPGPSVAGARLSILGTEHPGEGEMQFFLGTWTVPDGWAHFSESGPVFRYPELMEKPGFRIAMVHLFTDTTIRHESP